MIEKCSDTELKVQVVPRAASRTCSADDCVWDLRGACCQVRGGKLKARKGVNVPEVQIDCAALTEKDIEEKGESCHCTWKAVTVASQTHLCNQSCICLHASACPAFGALHSSTWARQDAEFLLKLDPPIEYICVSFVQKDQDLQELIDIMDRLQIPQDSVPMEGCK